MMTGDQRRECEAAAEAARIALFDAIEDYPYCDGPTMAEVDRAMRDAYAAREAEIRGDQAKGGASW